MHIIKDASSYSTHDGVSSIREFLYNFWYFINSYSDSVGSVSDYLEIIDSSTDFSVGAESISDTDWFVIRSKGAVPWEMYVYASGFIYGDISIQWYPGDGSGNWNGAGFGGNSGIISHALNVSVAEGNIGKLIFMYDIINHNIKILNSINSSEWLDFVYIGGISSYFSSDVDSYPFVVISGIPERDKLTTNGGFQFVSGSGMVESVTFDVMPQNSFVSDEQVNEGLLGDYRCLLEFVVGADSAIKFPARGCLSGVYIGYGDVGETMEVNGTEEVLFVNANIGGINSSLALSWKNGLNVGIS